jgi:glycosyltransferase involved in cell wall biosynthesis
MRNVPDVSVIIPCYNHAPFISERLGSVLSQTWKNLEIIFLDDGSTDGSFEAAAAFATDPRLALHRLDPPTGNPFAVWKLGLSLARAQLIWVAESDDACDPDLLAYLLPCFAVDPCLGLAYCQSLAIDAAGQITGSLLSHTIAVDHLRWASDYFCFGPEECRRALLMRNTIPNVSACLFRADAMRTSIDAAAGYTVCGDWAVYAKILASGWNIAFRAMPKNLFRRHPGSHQTQLAQSGNEAVETARVKCTILAAVGADKDTVAAGSVMTLERLTDLAVLAGSKAASSWFADGRLLADLVTFDPNFLVGLAGLSPGRRFWCDIYARDSNGFHEGRKVSMAYAPNRPAVLSCICPSGSLRLDPTQSPGLVRLHGLTLTGNSGRLRAVWEGERLRELTPGGTAVVLSVDEAGMLVWSYGKDPWLLVPPVDCHGDRVHLEVRLTGYSLVDLVPPLTATVNASMFKF